jgi:hypothetical protein
MSLKKSLSLLLVGLVALTGLGGVRAASSFADPHFQAQWQQDEAITPNFWGPLANAKEGQQEPYKEAPGGQRLVQYFDKGRMELATGASGVTVTSGLLVHELITGQLQRGDNQFQALAPAPVSVAGDSTNPFPLYRDLGSGPAVSTTTAVGSPVTLLLTPQGGSTIAPPQDERAVIALIDGQTGHGLPKGFADFRAHVGLQNVGLALTDPFWSDVAIAGKTQRILIQAFERRVLTYNSTNPAPFQVEFGNVGRQYYAWRYGTAVQTGSLRTVTLAASGQMITLAVGESFSLSLGSEFDWQIAIADPTIVSRDPAASTPAGSQGIYVARQAGQTTLTATGNPTCYTATPQCEAPSRLFRVQITVT